MSIQNSNFSDQTTEDVKQNNHPLYQGEMQIEMEIKKSKWEGWYNFKNYLHDLEKRIEAIPFWKHFTCVFSILFVIFAMLVGFIGTKVYWDQLPLKVPLFYSQELQGWEIFPKQYLYYVTGLVGGFSIFVYYLSYKLYIFDRRLSIIMNVFLLFVSVIFLIAYWQIMSLMII